MIIALAFSYKFKDLTTVVSSVGTCVVEYVVGIPMLKPDYKQPSVESEQPCVPYHIVDMHVPTD